jgi:hypothetical protein
MKKVFLALALVAAVTVSCKKVEAPASVTTPDSTSVAVDSTAADTTTVDTTTITNH